MSQSSTPLPPPTSPSLRFPVIDVWENPSKYEVRYVIGSKTWLWVMDRCKTPNMKLETHGTSALPSAQLAITASTVASSSSVTNTPRQRRRASARRSKQQLPATLRMEVLDPSTKRVVVAWHGTSAAFDGLEDKDALVRTIQRCRVEELHLSPPSVLINWDCSLEECRNLVGSTLPTVQAETNTNSTENADTNPGETFAVLKEPMGSQGKGIYFVRNVDEIHSIIDKHHQRARAEPDVLEALIAAKNRIPSWVLQAEVNPCLLIRNGRKFHIRTYVVIVERPENDEVLDLYVYHQHEVRTAGVPVKYDTARDRLAHITNGALSNTTERFLMSQEPELAHLQPSLEVFVAEIFAKHLIQDISRRVQTPQQPVMQQQSSSSPQQQVIPREFAVAGLDLMVTTSGRWYLLEVNVNPGAPTPEMALKENDKSFASHLEAFWKSLINLVAGKSAEGFYDAFEILERVGGNAND